MNIQARILGCFLVVALVSASANAMTIKNRTESAQIITIVQGGKKFLLSLAPGEKRYWNGVELSLIDAHGRLLRVSDPLNDYAVWESEIAIQRRPTSRGNGL